MKPWPKDTRRGRRSLSLTVLLIVGGFTVAIVYWLLSADEPDSWGLAMPHYVDTGSGPVVVVPRIEHWRSPYDADMIAKSGAKSRTTLHAHALEGGQHLGSFGLGKDVDIRALGSFNGKLWVELPDSPDRLRLLKGDTLAEIANAKTILEKVGPQVGGDYELPVTLVMNLEGEVPLTDVRGKQRLLSTDLKVRDGETADVRHYPRCRSAVDLIEPQWRCLFEESRPVVALIDSYERAIKRTKKGRPLLSGATDDEGAGKILWTLSIEKLAARGAAVTTASIRSRC